MSRPIEPDAFRGSVVVGVDGSDHAERAVRWGAEQASLENRRLSVVTVGDHAETLAADAVAAAQLLHPDLSVVGSAVSGDPAKC